MCSDWTMLSLELKLPHRSGHTLLLVKGRLSQWTQSHNLLIWNPDLKDGAVLNENKGVTPFHFRNIEMPWSRVEHSIFQVGIHFFHFDSRGHTVGLQSGLLWKQTEAASWPVDSRCHSWASTWLPSNREGLLLISSHLIFRATRKG